MITAAGRIARGVEKLDDGAVKHPVSIVFLCGGFVCAAQDAPKNSGAPSELAAPLRRFDRDRDGKLNEAEMKEARQAHNRGGREAEPNPRRWKEQLERREREFNQDRRKEFDVDGNGNLDDTEKKAVREVWQRVAGELTALRIAMTEKYDRNDDGELNEQERNASRAESDRQRREIEEKCIREWKEKSKEPEKKEGEVKEEKKP